MAHLNGTYNAFDFVIEYEARHDGERWFLLARDAQKRPLECETLAPSPFDALDKLIGQALDNSRQITTETRKYPSMEKAIKPKPVAAKGPKKPLKTLDELRQVWAAKATVVPEQKEIER
jgi:hypothetical protein